MNDFFDGGIGGYDDTPTSTTDTAQICMNGHLINSSYGVSPELNKKHCSVDGEPTITHCPHCQNSIDGEIHYSNVFGASDYKVPAFCTECGKPFPWTEKKIAAAKELAKELVGVTSDEVQVLETSIVEISKDNPQAQIGATRIKKIMQKVTSASGDVLRSVIIDVASETAKKVLLGR